MSSHPRIGLRPGGQPSGDANCTHKAAGLGSRDPSWQTIIRLPSWRKPTRWADARGRLLIIRRLWAILPLDMSVSCQTVPTFEGLGRNRLPLGAFTSSCPWNFKPREGHFSFYIALD